MQDFDHSTTTRGFAGHEMLDEVGIVHMNGRIYDPKIARFLQADPFAAFLSRNMTSKSTDPALQKFFVSLSGEFEDTSTNRATFLSIDMPKSQRIWAIFSPLAGRSSSPCNFC